MVIHRDMCSSMPCGSSDVRIMRQLFLLLEKTRSRMHHRGSTKGPFTRVTFLGSAPKTNS
jgi:hypothetical protein